MDEESAVLSLGIYAKQAEVLISKVRLEVIPAPIRNQRATVPIKHLDLLQVPFFSVHSDLQNLDFR